MSSVRGQGRGIVGSCGSSLRRQPAVCECEWYTVLTNNGTIYVNEGVK